MGETYKVSDSPKIQILENKLATDLAELNLEIEESGILQGAPTRPFSSVSIPKDVSYIRKERELLLKKGLQVAEAKQLVIQADVMQRELESCLKPEYTANSLPLLLHQFFTDRIHQLVQCKYLHMLRWERFCRHTKHIEQLYPLYKKQISHIMKEYDDAVQRAQRLSIARECLLTEAGNPSRCVTQEDVIIYLQWLVCHFYSVTTIHNYLRVQAYRDTKPVDFSTRTLIPHKWHPQQEVMKLITEALAGDDLGDLKAAQKFDKFLKENLVNGKQQSGSASGED
ncbi:putative uncharacterized protein C6orf183 [Hemitrygon akajei]|uniref:putative uncharacterized protein C6orf183 n=1 Tax=Hemitrygon akajei TaxID=2704970 RepID=UPI003BFA2E4B